MNKSIVAVSTSAMLLATLSFGALAQDAAVNCDTAQADIAHLQHEKKSTDERIAKGVFSIMPIGLAPHRLPHLLRSRSIGLDTEPII